MSDMEPHILRAAVSHRDMLRSMSAKFSSKLDFMPKYDGKPGVENIHGVNVQLFQYS